MMKIANAYSTDIYYGAAVSSNGNGFVQADNTTTAAPATGIIGVFVGCTYTDPNLKYKVFKQYWPASTVATDAEAYVVDDPDVVMQIQANGAVVQADVGSNITILTPQAGSTATGNSTASANAAASAATATLPLRIVGFVDAPDSAVGDAKTDILVKWNMPSTNGTAMIGGHSYMCPLGV
jgi:hypothetical protein